MPSLELLSSSQARSEFSSRVASTVDTLSHSAVDVNGGIKTTLDLKAHIAKGRDVAFSYARLIDESKNYK